MGTLSTLTRSSNCHQITLGARVHSNTRTNTYLVCSDNCRHCFGFLRRVDHHYAVDVLRPHTRLKLHYEYDSDAYRCVHRRCQSLLHQVRVDDRDLANAGRRRTQSQHVLDLVSLERVGVRCRVRVCVMTCHTHDVSRAHAVHTPGALHDRDTDTSNETSESDSHAGNWRHTRQCSIPRHDLARHHHATTPA
jgi:hypothetical protein